MDSSIQGERKDRWEGRKFKNKNWDLCSKIDLVVLSMIESILVLLCPLNSIILQILFGRIVMTYSMGFAFLTFGLIKKEIWWGVSWHFLFLCALILSYFSGLTKLFFQLQPVKSLYFVGFIIYFLVWPILFQVISFGRIKWKIIRRCSSITAPLILHCHYSIFIIIYNCRF